MSTKQYPKIGSKRKENPRAQAGSGKPCAICKAPTTGKVDVQISYMRGDDEVEPCCNSCQKGPNLLERILSAWVRKNENPASK